MHSLRNTLRLLVFRVLLLLGFFSFGGRGIFSLNLWFFFTILDAVCTVAAIGHKLEIFFLFRGHEIKVVPTKLKSIPWNKFRSHECYIFKWNYNWRNLSNYTAKVSSFILNNSLKIDISCIEAIHFCKTKKEQLIYVK